MSSQVNERTFLCVAILLLSALPLAAQMCPGPSPCALPPGALTLSSSSNPAVYGSAFTITATLQGPQGGVTPTGMVQFYDGSIRIPGPVALYSKGATAIAVLSIPYIPDLVSFAPLLGVLAAGAHMISASYSGDGSYLPLQPGVACLNQTITKAGTATAIGNNPPTVNVPTVSISPPSATGATFLIATASGPGGTTYQTGTPTGVVQFWSAGSQIGTGILRPVSSDLPGDTSYALLPGPLPIGFGVVYPGDDNYFGSTLPGPGLLPPPASTVAISTAPAAPLVGQAVTLIATVSVTNGSSAPSGTVQFFDKGAAIGTAPLTGGQAQFTTTSLTTGWHSLSANYSGDNTYPSAMSLYLSLLVNKPSVSLTLTSNPTKVVFGQSSTFTAALSVAQSSPGIAAPTGSIQFYSECLCGELGIPSTQALLGTTNISNGSATLTITSLPVGTSQIFANYSGDANWGAAISNVITSTTGKAATTTAWVSIGTDLKQITLSARMAAAAPGSGTPTGTVQFVDTTRNAILGNATVSTGGNATATIAVQPGAFIDSLAAIYIGDSNFAASSAPPMTFIAIEDSAGYGTSVFAPDEEVSIFGNGLATGLVTADVSQPPTSLGGMSVMIKDAAGTSRPASLLLVSPSQANIVIPAGVAPGLAMVTVTGTAVFSRPILISNTAPALFAASGRGEGLAAAQVIYQHADGTQDLESVATFDAAAQQWVANPIRLGPDPVYLVLYGTGIRHWSSSTGVIASINALNLAVASASAQTQFPGLDQMDVLLPVSLARSGRVSVMVTADGRTSNTVDLVFQ